MIGFKSERVDMSKNTMILEVGKTYLATQKGCSFELEGKMITFEDETTKFKVLEKPAIVLVDDGPNGSLVEEKLSGHLLEPHWYSVMDLDKRIQRWFSILHVDIEPIFN